MSTARSSPRWADGIRRVFATGPGLVWSLLIVLMATSVASMSAAPADAAASRVTICHQVGNLRYVVVTVDVNSVSGGGHGHHSGDIIPAFSTRQGNRDIHFGGRNLGPIRADGLTGSHVLQAGCAVPAESTQLSPPTSGQVATPTPPVVGPPTPTTGAVPVPTGTAIPTTGVQTTAVPETTELASTVAPTTSIPAPTGQVPQPTAPATAVPETTAPPVCDENEISHDGRCFPVPPMVVPPTPALQTVTSQPSSGDLRPILECVHRRDDGSSVVWFGYESRADETVVVERGASNGMSPAGTPPTLFGPGLHLFVVAVEITGGSASWTLLGQSVTSDDDSPDCDETVATTTTTATTTTATATTTAATEPATESTEPAATSTTQPDSPAGVCPDRERESADGCVSVAPVRLVLVDNVLECDGHGIARFAAFNDNVFALEGDDVTSLVSPTRLADDAPEVIDERDVTSADGAETAVLFTVRYVTAVSWTVAHDGVAASVSAGVNGADPNPNCPLAASNGAGSHGVLSADSAMPATGSTGVGPAATLAALVMVLGLVGVVAARRPLRRS